MNRCSAYLRGLSVLIPLATMSCLSGDAPLPAEPTATAPKTSLSEEEEHREAATLEADDSKLRPHDQLAQHAQPEVPSAAKPEGAKADAAVKKKESKARTPPSESKPGLGRKRFRPRLKGGYKALSKARASDDEGLGARGLGAGGGGSVLGGLGSGAAPGADVTAVPVPGSTGPDGVSSRDKAVIGRRAGAITTPRSSSDVDTASARPTGGKKRAIPQEIAEISVDEERANVASNDDGDLRDNDGLARDPKRHIKPDSFLPRMFYFEPTYLGGNAAAKERRRRLAEALPGHRLDALGGGSEAFDPPEDAGMGLTVRLDRPYLERPGRVFLEVGLRGSDRFGWRRPPLDVMVVVAPGAWTHARADVDTALEMLLRRLGAQDRMGLVVAGLKQPLIQAPARPRELRWSLAQELDRRAQEVASGNRSRAIPMAMHLASERLNSVMTQTASIPGTQTIILLTGPNDARSVPRSRRAAHRLTTKRAVFTSVVELDRGGRGAWWEVAAAGYGNYHRVGEEGLDRVIESELASLSRVVARLLRLNVRLGPHTRAIRVVGTRRLSDDEVRQVKAREVAIDTQLSKAQGVKADRGDDDDGVQTVIPYFYGGDSHVVLIELWVDRPGPVADVTLRYKDMVSLDNATARASASLGAGSERISRRHRAVTDHVRSATVAEHLKVAGQWLTRGDVSAARKELEQARRLVGETDSGVRQLLVRLQSGMSSELSEDKRSVWAEALTMAGERRLSQIR